MSKKEYPTITVGELIDHLQIFPRDFNIDFCGLEFYRLKQRGLKSVQMEFNQPVYLDEKGSVVVENPE